MVPLVVLQFHDDVDTEARINTVGHELAHIVLGHERFGPQVAEWEADDLAESWGFARVYSEESGIYGPRRGADQ